MELYVKNNRIIAIEEKDGIQARYEIDEIELPKDNPLIYLQKQLDDAIYNTKINNSDEFEITPINPHIYTICKWIREYRNQLLTESDWTQLSDSPVYATSQSEWQAYRQSLRDLPKTWGLPSEDTLHVDEKALKIDISKIKTKDDIMKLPFPSKPKTEAMK